MPNRPWKTEERVAAALFRAKRFTANQGGALDFEGQEYVGQVKLVKRLSLAALSSLAAEMERIGAQKSKVGVVTVKLRSGKGRKSPRLVVVTEAMWRELNGPSRADVPSGHEAGTAP